MPNDIDTLMALVHEINAKIIAEITDRDITVLIGYHRHNRSQRAKGFKNLKPVAPTLDVLKMIGLDKAVPKVSSGPNTNGLRRI